MNDAPTVRTMASANTKFHLTVWCRACRHQEDVAFATPVEAGHGDTPVVKLRFRCIRCRSSLTDFVVDGTQHG